jgi:hypothetical protein
MGVALPPGIPLRIGPAATFARARAFFRDAGYDDDAGLCRILSVKELHQADGLDWSRVDFAPLPAALCWCIDVFFRGLAVPESAARRICGDEVLAAFLDIGLLAPSRSRAEMVICPVWVYPVDGFIAVSDRRDDGGGATTLSGDDVVFPGLDVGTLRFLRYMPDARGGEALDLCGGCGVGAMHLTRTAGHAFTLDVTPRATAFAKFNAHLNDVPVTSLCGDLYTPVHGHRFGLITAHPPYVPTYGRAYVFRDGGDSGEIIIRRIVEGLPAHLRSGGMAMMVCAGRDTFDETFEQRVAGWLGPAAIHFDMVFALIKTLSINEIIESLQTRSQPLTSQEANELRTRLTELRTRQFAYGVLMLRHDPEPVTASPLRIRLTDKAGPADLDRLVAWRAFRQQADFKSWLSDARPRFAPKAELTARHVADHGRLVPAEFTFRSDGAFQSALRLDAWMTPVLATFDGKRSTQEAFDAARHAGDMPEAFTFDNFADLVGMMIELDILGVERRSGMQ